MTEDTHPTRRLYVSMLASLDGYIADREGKLDWFQDGDAAFEQYCDEMIDSVDLAIYGRKAYEEMVAYWPGAENGPGSARDRAFAKKMNALPKLVLSRTLTEATWSNTRIVRDRVAETITALKQQPGRSLVAWAGAGLVESLLALKLVDELRVLVQPVVLGGGTPLFRARDARLSLQLVRTTQLGANISLLCYEPRYA
ncbi:MAG: dihydrofolate reductase family protein [Polyangiales bacterium]